MEKRANEFLKLSGELYEGNKQKWRAMFENFDEDVYNDTIIKVYEHILSGEDTEGDLLGYWYKAFQNNLKQSHKRVKHTEEITESVKEKEDEQRNTNLYYSTIADILLSVRKRFNRKTFEIFRMYLLCKMSYEELDHITGVDSKERISSVRKWLKSGNKNFR